MNDFLRKLPMNRFFEYLCWSIDNARATSHILDTILSGQPGGWSQVVKGQRDHRFISRTKIFTGKKNQMAFGQQRLALLGPSQELFHLFWERGRERDGEREYLWMAIWRLVLHTLDDWEPLESLIKCIYSEDVRSRYRLRTSNHNGLTNCVQLEPFTTVYEKIITLITHFVQING